jgi:hypothetical protein
MYQVIRKYVPPAGQVIPGEHYSVTDPACRDSWFREISFYRSPHGREVATDGIRHTLANDGEIFRAVKAAVERYDADHNEEGR